MHVRALLTLTGTRLLLEKSKRRNEIMKKTQSRAALFLLALSGSLRWLHGLAPSSGSGHPFRLRSVAKDPRSRLGGARLQYEWGALTSDLEPPA